MKTRVLAVVPLSAILLAGAFIGTATADPSQRHHRRSQTLVQDEEERYVMVTGSNIPQKVKLKSIGTDTAFNVRIYTQRELQSTGRFQLAEALALDPSVQISSRGR